MRAVLDRLGILLEAFESFLLGLLILISIIIVLGCIAHNILKITEIYSEDLLDYKNLVAVDGNRMNINIKGNGEQTIVILSDIASPSPIIQYKTYTNILMIEYKVVTVEYFGYGFSLSTKTERTNEQIVREIKKALNQAGVSEPYILLANGVSSLYAFEFTNIYPESVSELITVDAVYPQTINENYISKKLKNEVMNARLTHFAEFTGFARYASYIKPDIFGIDKLEQYNFDELDIKLYRKMIANRFYTTTMINEFKKLNDNMSSLQNYQLPDYLPATQILSLEYANEYKEYKEHKQINNYLEDYANNIITNQDIQKLVVVNGKKNLNIYNPAAVINEILIN